MSIIPRNSNGKPPYFTRFRRKIFYIYECLINSFRILFSNITIRTNKKNNLEKTSGKSQYKHIPHREKPPHLVAKRNARERRRVQAVNTAFARLRKCVPFDNRNKRLSKVKTLQKAIEYIESLTDVLMSEKSSSNEETFATSMQETCNISSSIHRMPSSSSFTSFTDSFLSLASSSSSSATSSPSIPSPAQNIVSTHQVHLHHPHHLHHYTHENVDERPLVSSSTGNSAHFPFNSPFVYSVQQQNVSMGLQWESNEEVPNHVPYL